MDSHRGTSLEFVSDSFRMDREIVSAALETDVSALAFAVLIQLPILSLSTD